MNYFMIKDIICESAKGNNINNSGLKDCKNSELIKYCKYLVDNKIIDNFHEIARDMNQELICWEAGELTVQGEDLYGKIKDVSSAKKIEHIVTKYLGANKKSFLEKAQPVIAGVSEGVTTFLFKQGGM